MFPLLRLSLLIGLALCSQSVWGRQWLLRQQQETEPTSGRFHRFEEGEDWEPSKTAVIVCDMWDSHHGYRAALRTGELATRIDAFIAEARQEGCTIIHSPSDCMAFYAEHPSRARAVAMPPANAYPADIDTWCYETPEESKEHYPIDQSDGGEDDTPEEHRAWAKELEARGRNPRQPWTRQIETIQIDPERDFVSASGKEIWNILSSNDIEQVLIVGVHTNMCVMGRPFGLRRMKLAGKKVALVRDLTDTMYNPASWPYVSHFSGTDLIINYIERYLCPTVSSDQLLGGRPFRFAEDQRPHVAIVINEPEYETDRTLPMFANDHLLANYRVSFVYGDSKEPNDFPGLELIDEADVLFLSVRRRTPSKEQLQIVQDFVSSGKPVIGIRTANHAFNLRDQEAPAGRSDWSELDPTVFGGNYTNHYGVEFPSQIRVVANARRHPITQGIGNEAWTSSASLYRVSPLNPNTEVLLEGTISGEPSEPIAWTFRRGDGGKSFYTSLGAASDFDDGRFLQLLKNAIHWTTSAD